MSIVANPDSKETPEIIIIDDNQELINLKKNNVDEFEGLSKSQRKKLAKKKWRIELKKERKAKERLKNKEKRAKAKEEGLSLPKRRRTALPMSLSTCKIRIAIDLAFEKFMNERGIRNTLSQLNFCYGANRAAENPLQLYVVNLREQTKLLFDSHAGSSNWDIHITDSPLSSLWAKEEIVYLTAESENLLEKLEENKVYVIGGLVDHNAHKGLCHSIAKTNGFSHARLPIDQFVQLNTRKVLTINHVFEILLHFSEKKNWEEAFFSVIPKRKGIQKLNKPTNEETKEILL